MKSLLTRTSVECGRTREGPPDAFAVLNKLGEKAEPRQAAARVQNSLGKNAQRPCSA